MLEGQAMEAQTHTLGKTVTRGPPLPPLLRV